MTKAEYETVNERVEMLGDILNTPDYAKMIFLKP